MEKKKGTRGKKTAADVNITVLISNTKPNWICLWNSSILINFIRRIYSHSLRWRQNGFVWLLSWNVFSIATRNVFLFSSFFFFLPTLSLFTSSDNVFFNQTTMSNQCSVYPFILCCCRNTFVMHLAARDWISIKGLSRAILVSWEIKPLPFSAQRKLFF